MFKTHRIIYFILAILAAVGIAVGLLFAIQNFKTEEEITAISNFPSPRNGVGSGGVEKSTAADTAGWQTYRNEEYGFEFKYPNYLELQTTQELGNLRLRIGDSRKSDDLWLIFEAGIIKFSGRSLLPLNENLELLAEQQLGKQAIMSTNYDGKGLLVRHDGLPGYRYLIYDSFAKKGVDFGAGKEYLRSQEFNQILSTFKFVESKTETSDGKQFSLPGWEIVAFDYPTDWQIIVLDANNIKLSKNSKQIHIFYKGYDSLTKPKPGIEGDFREVMNHYISTLGKIIVRNDDLKINGNVSSYVLVSVNGQDESHNIFYVGTLLVDVYEAGSLIGDDDVYRGVVSSFKYLGY